MEATLDARAVLVGRLRAQRALTEGAIFARVRALELGPLADGDAEYMAGLRAAVGAAVEYALVGIEAGGSAARVPDAVREQARRAARAGVGLDTVLRRYVAGYALLEQAIVREAQSGALGSMGGVALGESLRVTGAIVQRLVGEVGAAYREEVRRIGVARALAAAGAERGERERCAPAAGYPDTDTDSDVGVGVARAHGGDAGEAVARVRVLGAFVDLAARRGFEELAVGEVVRGAGVSRRTFYELFPGGLCDCLRAALDEGAARCCALAARRLAEGGSPPEAVRRALASLLVLLDGEPALARVCFVESLSGGRRVAEHRERCVRAFQTLIVEYFQREVGEVDALVAESVIAAVMGMIYNRLLTREGRPLIELLGPLMGTVASSYASGEQTVVQEVAEAQELARAIAAGAPGWTLPVSPAAGGAGILGTEPDDLLPPSLAKPAARRARECVLFVASEQAAGRTPSNARIAAAIGVAHKPQISRLLARLMSEGLLAKRARPAGTANEWTLTEHGERMAALLASALELGASMRV